MPRRQLAVASPITPEALLGAFGAAVRRDSEAMTALRSALRERFGATAVALTDSGTSALVLALRAVAGEGMGVAFPGYACIDLTAAALFAGVRVRLYDLDPRTLSPDLESLERTLEHGARAVVIAHLYGYPADVSGASEIAARFGAPVIEDAAQGAWGELGGRLLGSFGPLTVLSFGRGKGITGGHGGALLSTRPEWDDAVTRAAAAVGAPGAARGGRALVSAGAQWALGRPSLYGIPSAIPGLRLGEMVYHAAHEPRSLSIAAAALVGRAIAGAAADVADRRSRAAAIEAAVARAPGVQPIAPVEGGRSGYLRLPVRDIAGRAPSPAAGILRGYPQTLFEQPELQPLLEPGEREQAGAEQLRRELFTLPTHAMVGERDLDAIRRWLGSDGRSERAGVSPDCAEGASELELERRA